MLQQDPGTEELNRSRKPAGAVVPVQTGRLVKSVMGRDRGRFYLVLNQADLSRVQVADGEVRKVENPKKKKLKHLKIYDLVASDLFTKAKSGKRITNVDIRQELKNLLESSTEVHFN
jgi:ribosomal protein L14E/L6E/L27E